MRTCSVDGCEKAYRARGLCATHYNQQHQPNRHQKIEMPCTYCGTPCMKHKSGDRRPFCDYTCRDLWSLERTGGDPCASARAAFIASCASRPPKPKPVKAEPADRRSPLRRAVEENDPAGVIAAVKQYVDIRPSGCWEWSRILKDFYPIVMIGKKQYQVHRLTLEARLGKPLGKQAAHHICANSFCVNPDHLQPVTHAENTAEMLARTYMVQRIRDLETALAEVVPDHPLLDEVSVAAA